MRVLGAFLLGTIAGGALVQLYAPAPDDRAYHVGFHDSADAAIDYLISTKR